MNRQDFTLILANQIAYADGLLASSNMALRLTWCERSVHDQLQLFNAGRSKCDGTHKISAHQNGKAIDLILIGHKEGQALDQLDPRIVCPDVWAKVRQHWIDLGGEPMIRWDPNHFEVK